MIKTAIILAGGFGTRLQSVVSEVPKPMAPVAGHPFLEFLLAYAHRHGVQKVVLSVGYKYELIQDYLKQEYLGMELFYAVETEPLGTGGAIWNALQFCEKETVLVLNGDSLFEVDIQAMSSFHSEKSADMVLALKPMKDFDRYGVVAVKEDQRIVQFKEKTYRDSGLINGGVYCFDTEWALNLPVSGRFSFEKEVMEPLVSSQAFYGFTSEAYFIDIGIPEDYQRAQSEFKEKLKWLN